MRINVAHIQVRAVSGIMVNVAVFDANASNGTDSGRKQLLAQLTAQAGRQLRIEQAALAYAEHGRIQYFGTPTLVTHLSRSGLPRWTHQIDF